jgi:hypothetical protein
MIRDRLKSLVGSLAHGSQASACPRRRRRAQRAASRVPLLRCAAVAGLAAAGCGAAPDPGESAAAVSEEIIGGVDGRGAALDMIGSLGIKDSAESLGRARRGRAAFRPFCTASLIGPSTVLTAKHCVKAAREHMEEGLEVDFTVGANASRPKSFFVVVDLGEAPVDEGGFLDMGSDVGIARLADAPPGLAPLVIAQLGEEDVGERFAKVGFGLQDARGTYGSRKVGTETLRALSGNVFDFDFGGYEPFIAWADVHAEAFGGRAARTDDEWRRFLSDFYRHGDILPGYGAIVGDAPGDSQSCNGDSGGPLVRRIGGHLEVYGVESAGLHSHGLCDHGGIDAIFGPTTYRFLEEALARGG